MIQSEAVFTYVCKKYICQKILVYIIFSHCKLVSPNSNPMCQSSSYKRYLLIRDIFMFVKFNNYPIKQTYLIWRKYNFAKIAKLCETCNDLCNVERKLNLIWKSFFKNTFKNQTLESLFAQENRGHLSLSKNQIVD